MFHPDYRVLVKGKEKVFHANVLKRYVWREEAPDVAVGGSKCVQSVGDFVPWSEISPLLDEVDMSVPKVPSISSGDFHAAELVCSAGVVQDQGEDVLIPTLSVPESFLMRMFRASSLMLLCRKFSWVNSRRFFKHMLIF